MMNVIGFNTLKVDKRNIPIEEDKKKVHPAEKQSFIEDMIQAIDYGMSICVEIEGPSALNVDSLELLGYILDVIENNDEVDFVTLKNGFSVLSNILPMAQTKAKSA